MPSVTGLGTCTRASNKRFFISDYFRTTHDFGCVEHEPRKPKTSTLDKAKEGE